MIYLVSAVISVIVAAIEGISFAGYIQSHTGIPAYFFYVLSVVLSILPQKPNKLNFKFINILGTIFILIYSGLIFLETINYPNFVFTHFHINPVTFLFFITILWFHILVFQGFKVVKSLLIAGLIFVGTVGTGRTTGIIYSNLSKMILNPLASYDSKMAGVYPGFYPAIQKVKELIPQDATVYIPPQGNPWEVEGNGAMVTYFLYPRKVINLDPETISEMTVGSYILIAKGSWPRTGEVDYGWPKVPVKAKQIWHIDLASNSVLNFTRDYDPLSDKWDWGLIEVAHD